MLLEDCLIKSHESIEVLTEQVLSKTHCFLDQSLKEYESNQKQQAQPKAQVQQILAQLRVISCLMFVGEAVLGEEAKRPEASSPQSTLNSCSEPIDPDAKPEQVDELP